MDFRALRTPPDRLPADAVIPPPLDFGETPEGWRERRPEIAGRRLDFLGPFPERCDLAAEVLEEQEFDTYIRRRVRYRVEDLDGGVWVEAFLLSPKEVGEPAPAVVVFHPTSHFTLREPIGLAGPSSLHTALHLVERGYVVLCPRNFLWDYRGHALPEATDWREPLEALMRRFAADHPGWTGMGKMVWDGIRAVDYLCSLDGVDGGRIGCFGFSLGGKEALYVPAFDERIRAAVSAEGGIALAYSNWHDSWYLGGRVRDEGFAMDNHEVLALIAPRAFLLVGSMGGVSEDTGEEIEGYDGERSWPFIEVVLPLWRMFGAEERIGVLSHGHGHSMPRVARDTAYAWLDAFLA